MISMRNQNTILMESLTLSLHKTVRYILDPSLIVSCDIHFLCTLKPIAVTLILDCNK